MSAEAPERSSGRHLSIGEVLAQLRGEFPDITISKIRFLESQGLIDPERTPSGYRKFYPPDLERLRWILYQQRDHFLPLRVIKDRLDAYGPEGAPAIDSGLRASGNGPGSAPRPTAPPPAAPLPARPERAPASPPAPSPDRPTPPTPAPSEKRPDQQPPLVRPTSAETSSRADHPAGVDRPTPSAPTPTPAPSSPAPTPAPTSAPAAPAPVPSAPPPRAVPPAPASPPKPPAPEATSPAPTPLTPVAPSSPPKAPAPAAPPRESEQRPDVISRRDQPRPDPPRPEPPPKPPLPFDDFVDEAEDRDDELGAIRRSDAEPASTHMTRAELLEATGLTDAQLDALEEFGIVVPLVADGAQAQYDDEALAVAEIGSGFYSRGIEARHLKMYWHFAEREAALFSQVLIGYVRQRNPTARKRLQEDLEELARLGRQLRTAMLRRALGESLSE